MQKNFIFSDTETTGLSDKPKSFKKDFIQIIQSGSILTDANFERIDSQNVECRPLPMDCSTTRRLFSSQKNFNPRLKYLSLSDDERYL